MTGNQQAEIARLKVMGERYRDDPAVLRKIGRIIFNLLGEDKRPDLRRRFVKIAIR